MNSSGRRPIINPDILRKELMAAGERLNAALNLECDLSWSISRNEGENLVDQWHECRRSVRRFSEDYELAAESYRIAVKNAVAAVECGRLGSSAGPEFGQAGFPQKGCSDGAKCG
jgi:hypothetical protein